MKKLLFLAVFVLSFSLVMAQAPVIKKQTAPPAKEAAKTEKAGKSEKLAKGQKAVSGVVVNLLSAITNAKPAGITKADAEGFVARGEHLALYAGNKLYIIVNPDGTSCDKKLAAKAGKDVKVTGKSVSKAGINAIIASTID
ncbi:MAG: hypothetical protein NT007_14635 [Candidatus Kapabacteria bacterium]|nr:hypothetical protein [Candidatus Kapabacteria bacterium]